MNNITRDDIAEFINNEFGLTKKDCNNLVNDIIEEIIEGLNEHNIVKIHNFGTFKLRRKNARIGRNPKTGTSIVINKKYHPYFRASKSLKRKLNS